MADAGKGEARERTGVRGEGAPAADARAMNVGLAVACGAAIALRTYQSWLLNNGLLPTTSAVFTPASEVQTAVGVLIELIVLFAAMRAPRLLRPRPLLAGSLVCCAIGVVVLWAFAAASPIGATVGLVARMAGSLFGAYLLGIALSQVGDARLMAVSASCAVLAATCVARLVPAPAFHASIAIDAALTLVSLALTWRAAEPTIARIAEGPEVEVWALANPRSFLPSNHQVFVLMLIFSVAVGFGSTLRIADFVPRTSGLSIVALACVLVWFLLAPAGRRHGREDALFVASALLVAAGFLAVPLEGLGMGTANALLYAGRLAFSVLSWTALAALCARNPAGAVMVLACGELANGVGVFMGLELGYLCNMLLVAHPEVAAAVTSAAVLALFAYALTGLRGFSFAETIRGVEPAAPLPSPEPAAPSREQSLDAACDRLSAERGLTEREREVLGMLARGHNGYRIRDELTLSYNTVKTHVKRIYRKLDVHSQQELIDLVEHEAEGGSA